MSCYVGVAPCFSRYTSAFSRCVFYLRTASLASQMHTDTNNADIYISINHSLQVRKPYQLYIY